MSSELNPITWLAQFAKLSDLNIQNFTSSNGKFSLEINQNHYTTVHMTIHMFASIINQLFNQKIDYSADSNSHSIQIIDSNELRTFMNSFSAEEVVKTCLRYIKNPNEDLQEINLDIVKHTIDKALSNGYQFPNPFTMKPSEHHAQKMKTLTFNIEWDAESDHFILVLSDSTRYGVNRYQILRIFAACEKYVLHDIWAKQNND